MSTVDKTQSPKVDNENGDEQLLEKKEPAAPFALVGLSYLVILGIASLVLATFLYFF